jgi:hypothetical protein
MEITKGLSDVTEISTLRLVCQTNVDGILSDSIFFSSLGVVSGDNLVQPIIRISSKILNIKEILRIMAIIYTSNVQLPY